MSKLNITIAESKQQKQLADAIVVNYHSYVSSARTVGRCIKYLIYYDEELVGTFWLGSGFKPTPKAILNYFDKSQKEFDSMFNMIADNWKKIGETAGLPSDRKSVSMKWNDTEEIKEKFTKPTGENKKAILITNKLPNSKMSGEKNELY